MREIVNWRLDIAQDCLGGSIVVYLEEFLLVNPSDAAQSTTTL